VETISTYKKKILLKSASSSDFYQGKFYALTFCYSEDIFELCKLIFSWTDTDLEVISTKYPIALYKLMIFYQELDAFRLLCETETTSKARSQIITES
jgi:hypothetical protein